MKSEEARFLKEERNLMDIISKEVTSIKGIVQIVVFTALVFLATSIFYLSIPLSGGFFNLGEAFIYLAALIGGPLTGGIAGGLGASMADLALGYGIFAPATAVLKFLEGFVVGSLFSITKRIANWIKYAAIGVVCAFLMGFSGFFMLNTYELGFDLYGRASVTFNVPGYVFFILAVILSSLILFVMFKFGERGDMAISCFLGGLIIVIGYFLYEYFLIYEIAESAFAEIPFNFFQVIFGSAIAIPIVSYLRELGVLETKKEKNLEILNNSEENNETPE